METRTTKTKTGRRGRLLVAGTLVLVTAMAGLAARGTSIVPALHLPSTAAPGALRYTASNAGPVTFSGNLDKSSVLVGGDGLVRMEMLIGGEQRSFFTTGESVPTDLLVVLDTSGSMAGQKIVDARRAIAELLANLGPDDRFALVTYNNTAQLSLPFSPVVGGQRDGLAQAIARIPVGGGTNMSSGLELGLSTLEHSRRAGRTPHTILISDGLANQGDVSHAGLVGRASRAARGEFMLTTVGVGSDFHEYLMSAIADAGTGNYYYLEESQSLANVFAREFDAARTTVASGLALEIQPAGGVTVVEAAGYPLERNGASVVLRPGSLFAGQERRIWVTLKVPNGAEGEHALGRFALSYTDGGERSTVAFDQTPQVASIRNEDEFFAEVDVPTWERSVTVDSYNKVQEEVARKVKDGDREGAMQALSTFRDDVGSYNARLRSQKVDATLESLDEMERKVGEAFVGGDQVRKQNELSKAQSAGARDARRVGSKK